MKRFAAVIVLLATAAVQAASFRGTVTHVSDGDTLWVRPARGGAPVAIRLLGIDAPESCQAFGRESQRALARRVLHATVTVHTRARDDYHRQLARIEQDGEDLNAWLVREGYAWSSSYRGRRGPYAALEQQARRARAGLWAAPRPEEPRSFRHRFGPCH